MVIGSSRIRETVHFLSAAYAVQPAGITAQIAIRLQSRTLTFHVCRCTLQYCNEAGRRSKQHSPFSSVRLVVFEIRLLVFLCRSEGIDKADIEHPTQNGALVFLRERRSGRESPVPLSVKGVRKRDHRGQIRQELPFVPEVHDIDGAYIAL